MAQSVKHPTPGFGPGHDLMLREFEPRIWLHADSVESALYSLSLPLSLPLPHSLFLQINKLKKKKRRVSGNLSENLTPNRHPL